MKSKSIESSLYRQGVFILHVAILNSRLNAANANRAELFKLLLFDCLYSYRHTVFQEAVLPVFIG